MKSLKGIGLGILAIFVVMAGIYTTIHLDAIIGKWQKDVDREVFKETRIYNESAASFLADAYKDYNDAETDSDKDAIMEYVVMRYPNLDYENIDNRTLRNFYRDCVEH